MGLHNVDQLFIQNMMASRYLTLPATIQLYNQCLDLAQRSESTKVYDEQDLESRVSKINRQLESIELQLKAMRCPRERQTYWGLCNTVADEAARIGTAYSPVELELFFHLVDELCDSNGEVELKVAQNLDTPRSKGVKETSRTIAKFSEAGWLKIVRSIGAESCLIFGPRALLELPTVRKWALQKVEDVVAEERGAAVQAMEVDESEEEAQRGGERRRGRRAVVSEGDEEDEEEEIQVQPRQRRRTASRRSAY